LDIQNLHFQPVDSPDIQKDLAALRGGIRTARQVVQLPHIAEHILQEAGSDGQTDEEFNEYIFEYLSTYLVSLVLPLFFLTDLKQRITVLHQ
jgi:DNA-binding FrmR family transcriptional regulator